MSCPDDDTLTAFCEGGLARPARDALEHHLDDCADCRVVVSDFARSGGETARDQGAALLPGDRVGRYAITGRLGEGGMGIVYAARDPDLAREVALKFLQDEDAGHLRLSREARALARLAHPNVVTVYEVGFHAKRPFVAMELVPGDTLAGWLSSAARRWQEVVAAFVQAGAGLRAAHDAGIVHLDFKLSNVLVGDDGRVRVVDFGVARVADAPIEDERVGAILGTPAFMAPEQKEGQRATELSDQYSFCLALAQALARAQSPAPPGVRDVIDRGLAPDPTRRWGGMSDLLVALDAAVGAPRPGHRAIAIAVIAAVVAAAGSLVAASADGRDTECTGAASRFAGIWDDARRARITRLFARVEPDRPGAFASTRARLDAAVEGWNSVNHGACIARRDHRRTDAVYGAQMMCLEQVATEIAAFVDTIEGADKLMVEHAERAAGGLGDAGRCADLASVGVEPAAPTVAATAAVREVRTRVFRARALSRLGRPKEALAEARAAEAASQGAGYSPARAEALLCLGELLFEAGDHTGAERSLIDAVREAERGAHDEVRTQAAVVLISVVGIGQARPADAHQWQELAEAMIERLGARATLHLRLRLLNESGRVLSAEGKRARAHEYHQRALALAEAEVGPDSPLLAATLSYLAETMPGPGPEQIALFERALALVRAARGDDHPLLAIYLLGSSGAQVAVGNYAAGISGYARVIELYERAFGTDYPDIAVACMNLAETHLLMENPAKALPEYERALRITLQAYGPDDHFVGLIRAGQARAELALGNVTRAAELAQIAVANHRSSLAPDHPQNALTRVLLAEIEVARGNLRSGLGLHDEAVAAAELIAADHPEVIAEALIARGEALLSGRSPDRALADADRAAGILDQFNAGPRLRMRAGALRSRAGRADQPPR